MARRRGVDGAQPRGEDEARARVDVGARARVQIEPQTGLDVERRIVDIEVAIARGPVATLLPMPMKWLSPMRPLTTTAMQSVLIPITAPTKTESPIQPERSSHVQILS